MVKHTPDSIKQDFYFKFSDPKNYNDLIIKKNNITTNLKEIFNNNIWSLKTLAEELQTKQIIGSPIIANKRDSHILLMLSSFFTLRIQMPPLGDS